MRIDVKFTDSSQEFKTQFRDAVIIKDGYTQEELDAAVSDATKAGYAEGEAKGYDKGVAKVEADNAEILAECNAVLTEKGVDTGDTLAEVPERIGSIKTEPMWLPYIRSCYAMFRNATFPENTELVLALPSALNYDALSATFQNTKNVTSIKLIVPADDAVELSCQGMCNGNTDIRRLDITEFDAVVYNWVNAFYMASNLEEIIGEIRCIKKYAGQNFGNAFYICSKLREVRFGKDAIWESFKIDVRLLSDASIQSVIDGLMDMTGQTAQTITFHAAVGAKLTEEQKATITAKNWTLVY